MRRIAFGGLWVGGWKSEIPNPKFEITMWFPAIMLVPAAGVAEWQTLGT